MKPAVNQASVRTFFVGPELGLYTVGMLIRVVEFSSLCRKFERFLPESQHTQRKPLNFENWTNGEPQKLAKIKVFKVDCYILLLFLVLKLRLVAQNQWKKHTYIFTTFSTKKRVSG